MSDLVKKQTTELSANFKPNLEPSNDFQSGDFLYGWLRIAQRTTKAILEGTENYIEGLKAGMFFNSLDGTVYGKTVKVSVIKFFRSFSEHQDEKDKKFIRALSDEGVKPYLNAYGGISKDVKTTEGNLIKEQYNYMVLLPDHPDAGMVRLAVSPGGFMSAKAWNTQINQKSSGYPYAGIWEIELKFNDGDNPYYTIGVGSKPAVKFLGFISGDYQFKCEEAVIALHENMSRVIKDAPDAGSDIPEGIY